MVIGLINQQLANYGPMVPPEGRTVSSSPTWHDLVEKKKSKTHPATLQQSLANSETLVR